MHFRGMSDWTSAALEDIDWDVFGKSDDHIVPHQGGELLAESSVLIDAHKKPRHEVKIDVEKNMCSRGSAMKTVLWGKEDAYYPSTKNGCSSIVERSRFHTSNVVVPTLCDVVNTANYTALPSQDSRIFDYCVNEYTAASNMFCSKDPSLGTRTNDNKSCLSSLNGVSPDVTDLSFLEREQKGGDTDLAYYDWPDIGNFEDIDKMFRNWDSIGQGQTGTADELSWFSSSSNTIYGSEIAFEPGVQSASSDVGKLHDKSESHFPNGNYLPKTVPAKTDHDEPTSSHYADWLGTDAPSKGKSAGKKKSCDRGDEINNSGLTQISNEYSYRSGASDVKMESQLSSEGKGTKRSTDQMLLDSDVSVPQIYCSQQISQQKHFTGSSGYMHNLDPQSQLEFGLPVHQVPFTQISSSVEFENGTNISSSYKVSNNIVNHPTQYLEKFPVQLYMPQVMASEENIEKLYERQQLCGTVTAEHPHQQPTFRSKASVHKKLLETRDDIETEDIGLELPTVEMDHPTAQESSGMTSFSSDDSSEDVTSFRQLQDVMHQLDVRTKLCIRESLYRLARSAGQRHGFTTQNFSEGTSDTKGIHGTEASKGLAEFINAETGTNPIDRTIAHLLFHRPSEHSTRSVDDAGSLESHIMNEQILVPIANQVLIPNQFDQQRIFGGSSDMETDLP